MTPHRRRRAGTTLLTTFQLLPSLGGGAPDPIAATMGTTPLHIHGGRVDADIRQLPLGTIAATLRQSGAVRVALFDPQLAAEPVSLSVRAEPLERALMTLFQGFSYAMGRTGEGGIDVIVLSTPRWHDHRGDAPARTCVEEPSAVTAAAEPSGAHAPRTLDEFRPITAASCRTATTEPMELDETRLREQAIQRALDVLESPHRHLYPDAIEQLGMYRDERASTALIKLTAPSSHPERYLAIEALARLSEQSEFQESSVTLALERLMVDADAEVRRLAGLAVEQMHRAEAGGDEPPALPPE